MFGLHVRFFPVSSHAEGWRFDLDPVPKAHASASSLPAFAAKLRQGRRGRLRRTNRHYLVLPLWAGGLGRHLGFLASQKRAGHLVPRGKGRRNLASKLRIGPGGANALLRRKGGARDSHRPVRRYAQSIRCDQGILRGTRHGGRRSPGSVRRLERGSGATANGRLRVDSLRGPAAAECEARRERHGDLPSLPARCALALRGQTRLQSVEEGLEPELERAGR